MGMAVTMNRRHYYALLTLGLVLGVLIWLVATRFHGRLSEAQLGGESVIALHKASTHFPIGLLLTSAAFDLAGVVFRRSDLTSAAFWTLLAGTVGAVGATLLGLLGDPFATDASQLAMKVAAHQRVGIASVVIFGVICAWRLTRRQKLGRIEGVFYSIVTLVGVALVSYTGYLGGHLLD
jgi:uncharacterized membrane protein